GSNVREWIQASDHCRAIDVILHSATAGAVYNIGSGQEISNLELTKLILEYLDKGEEMIERVKDRAGHDRRYAIDHRKLTEELGWKPEKSFEVGLKETVEWYKNNEWWWKKIKNGDYLKYYESQYTTR
ncbi:MAG: GDP-mannose 4,6-dehydratase, partial [Patescibacteria group bacterium]